MVAVDAVKIAREVSAGRNVMLYGPAGTGKTAIGKLGTQKAGFNLSYYSAAMLDPYIDLIGVPHVYLDEEQKRRLAMVKPDDILNAEVLFVDELNRGAVPTLNALFEAIQFHTINGTPLPNLKAVITAINPPEKGYRGNSELDTALVDRFDKFYEVPNIASREFFGKRFGDDMGKALVEFHSKHDHEKGGYISPRRLEKIGEAWEDMPNRDSLTATLPPGVTANIPALFRSLSALRKPAAKNATKTNKSSNPAGLEPRDIRRDGEATRKLLEQAGLVNDRNALHAVAVALSTNVGVPRLMSEYRWFFETADAADLKLLMNDWKKPKLTQLWNMATAEGLWLAARTSRSLA